MVKTTNLSISSLLFGLVFKELFATHDWISSRLWAHRYQNAITRTEKALNKASEIFKRLSRDGTNKRLIVVTDGQTTPQNNFAGLELLREPTEDLKAAGVHVTAVGVGTMVKEEELNFMATDPDKENVLHFDNYDELLNMVDTVSQAICPASITNGMKHWFCPGFCAFVVCMKKNKLFFFREGFKKRTVKNILQRIHDMENHNIQ